MTGAKCFFEDQRGNGGRNRQPGGSEEVLAEEIEGKRARERCQGRQEEKPSAHSLWSGAVYRSTLQRPGRSGPSA